MQQLYLGQYSIAPLPKGELLQFYWATEKALGLYLGKY